MASENTHHIASDVLTVLRKDPVMAQIVEQGLSIESAKSEDIYFRLLSAIVSQQLSTKAAATIFGRFKELFPDNYPHAHLVLETPDETLRGAGLSFQKIGYVRNVAAFAQGGNLEHALIDAMEDEA
ncbi:hypothetical protein [Pontibacter sp. BAB1700]